MSVKEANKYLSDIGTAYGEQDTKRNY